MAKAGTQALNVMQPHAGATPPEFSIEVAGESGSSAALERLRMAAAEFQSLAIQPLLDGAIAALNRGDIRAAEDWALKALDKDERSGVAWYALAVAREQSGDFGSSIKCYEAALKSLPDHAEIANNLGRLAFRLGQLDVAEKLFHHFLTRYPNHPEGANNLACALRAQGRFDEAIEVLKASLTAEPGHAIVWNTLGTVMAEQGDMANAAIFFDEAIRLDPTLSKARYNRGNMSLALGDPANALADCDRALAQTTALDERAMMRLAKSTILINLGRIGEGWDEYEARLDPHFAGVTQFIVDRPNWAPEIDLKGKSLLVIGEQGLGDEILFANTVPDILAALGTEGRLSLAVEPRLVGLFQRSFPSANVGAHATYDHQGRTVRVAPFLDAKKHELDFWTPIASPLRRFRRTIESFPPRPGYLVPDPDRVAHWKTLLAELPPGPKIGLLWKSAVANSGRHRFFSAFEQWAPILGNRNVTFVNLQYGDCRPELETAERDFNVKIWTPPDIDLKQHLDDVAALSCAMDLVIGFSNATFNIAAACGVPAWLISNPGAWPRLGTARYPWYPQVRVYLPEGFGAWDPIMARIGVDVAKLSTEWASNVAN